MRNLHQHRWIVTFALLVWVAAAPFLGPGHAILHGGAPGDASCPCESHQEADSHSHTSCPACEAAGDELVAFGLCEIPDCPDPTHHHHGSEDSESGHHCALCHAAPLQAAALAPLAEPAPAQDSMTAAQAIRLGFDHAGTPGARAPPALQI